MADENVDTIRRGFEAYNRDGVEALLAFLDPEFEAVTAPELTVEPDTYRGHEGIRRYFESFFEVMEDIRFEPQELIDAGDQVVVLVRLHARGKDTGIEADQSLFQVWTVRDGKALRLETFAERSDALRAAGLS
jgi:hypothetical protein